MKRLLAMAMAGVTAIALGDSIAVTPVQDEHGLDTAFDLALEVTGEKYLYAAWGAEDAGTDRAVWANQRLLGVANSSSNTWHFVAPEGWSYSLKSLRFFLVEKESRPYDQRVEWIESTGKEWINTGYIGRDLDDFYAHFVWYSGMIPFGSYGGSSASANQRLAVLHIEGTNNSNGGTMLGCAKNSKWATAHDAMRDSRRGIIVGKEIYTRTEVTQPKQTVYASSTGFEDMGKTSIIEATSPVANTTAPIYIFCRNCGNTEMDVTKTATKVDNKSVVRLYSFRATHSGVDVLDFVPCVKNGKAMLWDRVNNRLHGNVSGAGALVAGPVVEDIAAGATTCASAAVAAAVPAAGAVVAGTRTVSVAFERGSGVFEAAVSRSVHVTNVLYAAWGSVPGGETPESWEHVERVALVLPETERLAVKVPGWGEEVFALRLFLRAWTPYPFDTELRWIESTGNEWINTGWVGAFGDAYDIKWREEGGGNFFVCGAYTGSTAKRFTVAQSWINTGKYGGSLQCGYDGYLSGSYFMQRGVDFVTHTEYSSGFQAMKGSVDGAPQFLFASSTATAAPTCTSPLYLFARNCSSTSVDHKMTGRIYYCTITHDGETVRDFRPVLKDGEAGMYDFANDNFHANISGTGAFVAGPAVPESNGRPGTVVSCSDIFMCAIPTGTTVVKGVYATTADFTFSLGSAGAANSARIYCEYGTSPGALDSSVLVKAAMTPGESDSFTLSGLSANTTYCWRIVAETDVAHEVGTGTFTTQGAYRTVSLGEVLTGQHGETYGCHLEFGPAVQGETCRLVLAYGATAGGVDLASWEGCIAAGTVTPDTTSMDYAFPSGIIDGAYHYRFYLIADGTELPGVAELEYLESTGREWIDTEWIGGYDDDYDLSFRSLNSTTKWFMLGAYGRTVNDRYTVMQADGKYESAINGQFVATSLAVTNNVDIHFTSSLHQGALRVSAGQVGKTMETATSTYAVASTCTNVTQYLFCRNCGNTSVDNVSAARLYSCAIDHNGTRVRDFVPCVKDGVAGLYDRVRGRFHGNISGEGAFMAGPVVGGGAAAIYSYTVPTNGVGFTGILKSEVVRTITMSSAGNRYALSGSIDCLGIGTTYPFFEYWMEGDSVTNVVAFAGVTADDGLVDREYSAVVEIADWNRTVNFRFAVSNVCALADGGFIGWHDASQISRVEVKDTATYVWQDVNGDWNGDWTNTLHWACSNGANGVGYPTANATAVVSNCTAVITMPDGIVQVTNMFFNAKDTDVTFYNAANAATLKPYSTYYPGDTTGTPWNTRVVFDGVTHAKRSPTTALSIGSGETFVLRGGATINSTVLDMINTENKGYTGRVEIGAGSRWPTADQISTLRLGGDGVIRVDGELNVKEFKIGQYGYWGGGTLEMGGEAPVVHIGKLLRCWNGKEYTVASHVAFDIPANGWLSAPLLGGTSADPLAGGTESANVAAKLCIEVRADSALIAARNGYRDEMRVPLISWPTGITVNRITLDPGNESRVRFAWTYGNSDSETSDGNPPTGLVAYVHGNGGTAIFLR